MHTALLQIFVVQNYCNIANIAESFITNFPYSTGSSARDLILRIHNIAIYLTKNQGILQKF